MNYETVARYSLIITLFLEPHTLFHSCGNITKEFFYMQMYNIIELVQVLSLLQGVNLLVTWFVLS